MYFYLPFDFSLHYITGFRSLYCSKVLVYSDVLVQHDLRAAFSKVRSFHHINPIPA